MFLRDFISINEAGSIEPVVNLDMMDDADKNRKLCESFVFNYNSDRPKKSTVGLLEILLDSYQSRNYPNIHCVVQDYGKGKTHFALAIANFFSKLHDSEEVKGIFNSIKIAAGEKNKALVTEFEGIKRRGRHLVFCLRGDKCDDLRKHFLQVVINKLEQEGIKDAIAHQLCSRPLNYLTTKLDENKKALANRYLKKIKAPEGDLEALCDLLRQNNHHVIPLVVEVANAITDDFAPDFKQHIDVEEILEDLIKKLCTGHEKRYSGILIIFDELNYYLESWIENKNAAGGSAIQNITNFCDNHKAKIALISFTQVNPNSKSNRVGFQQVSSRLAHIDDTYSPVSSLERVIDDVIVQQDNEAWKIFRKKWDNVFWGDSQRVYKRARKYQDGQNLNLQDFHKHLGLGCFPLHPLTGYLLCNLEFTQGRTAIEFVRKEVGEFLHNSAETNQPFNSPNYIYAISLVEAFAPNFRVSPTKSALYETYRQTLEAIAAEADENEIKVVKAIFLYIASGDLIVKQPNETHEKILADLTGLPEIRLKEALDRLTDDRQAIHKRNDGIYQFFTGTNPRELEQRVIAEVDKQIPPQPTEITFVEYCREIGNIFSEESTKANKFAAENGLSAKDWSFENQIFTTSELEKLLETSAETAKNRIAKIRDKGYYGIVAHVVDNDAQELDGLWDELDTLLQKSAMHQRLVIAIPTQTLGEGEQNLGRIIQKLQVLKNKFKSEQGTASYNKLLNDWEKYLRDRTHDILNRPNNLRHHSIVAHKIPLQESKFGTYHVSNLLDEIYPFVPSVGNDDKLSISPKTTATGTKLSINAVGNKIATVVAGQLFAGKGKLLVASLPKESSYTTAIDNAFVSSWGVFKKTSNAYILQEPTNQKVRDAWDKLSQLCALNGEKSKEIFLLNLWKVLSEPPYGYNQITFTVLLACWLSFHREEVMLKGIPDLKVKTPQPMQTKGLEEWSAANIFEKADVFVDKWIVNLEAKLIRKERVASPKPPSLPTEYEKAIAYIAQAKDFLETNANTPEVTEVKEWQTRLNRVLKDFDSWCKPIQESADLSLDTSIEKIVQLYPQVIKECPVTDIVRTSSQNEKQHQAQQRLQQIIEKQVEDLQIEPENLNTIQDCVATLGKIEAAIRSLGTVSDLPDHYVRNLDKSKSAITQRQNAIAINEQITQKLREVQSRYEGLSQNATQQELMDAQVAIAQFAEILPALRNETKYQETVQKISDREEQLKQQIQVWISRSLNDLSQLECIKLREELVKQESRYTFAEDKKQLKELLSHLERKIENDKSSQTIADDNEKSINQAGESPKSIGEAKSIGQMFDNYKHLQSLHIRTHADLDTREVENRLSQLKDSGLKILGNRIMRELAKCDLVINKQEEYNQRKNVLQQLQIFLPIGEEFNDIRTEKESAVNNLEDRYREFVAREKIRKIIKHIIDLPLSLNSTIHHCEESLQKINNSSKEITDLSKQNSNIIVDCTEINNRIKQFEDQIAKQCEQLVRLQNRIETIADPKELDRFKTDYAKLDLVFKDSSHYGNYQQLQTKIDELDDSLDVVRELEKLKQKSNSIVECQNSQQKLAEASKNISDRFQPQIQAINQYLSDRIDQYRHDLQDLEQRLTTLTGLKPCQSLEAELSRKSNYYLGSEIDEDRYRLVQSQLSRLQELYKLVDTAKRQTLEDYDQHLQAMQKWLDEDGQIPEWMGDRYSTIRRETEKNRQAFIDEKRKQAREWVKQVDLERIAVDMDSNPERKAEKAHKLIQRIKTEKPNHISGLTEDLENTIKEIEQKCNSIIESNLEIQIIARFRQLPQSRRNILYTKMQDYLTDKTEDA